MGQYKVDINISLQLLFGIKWDRGYYFSIEILCFSIYLGLLKEAHGINFRILK